MNHLILYHDRGQTSLNPSLIRIGEIIIARHFELKAEIISVFDGKKWHKGSICETASISDLPDEIKKIIGKELPRFWEDNEVDDQK